MTPNSHPYKDLDGTELWKKVSQGIDDLVKNQDINITTQKEYVIDYLCKMIVETKNKDSQEKFKKEIKFLSFFFSFLQKLKNMILSQIYIRQTKMMEYLLLI